MSRLLNFKATSQPRRGFTLVEMLVSLAILLLIMLVVASMVNQTNSVWTHTVGRVEQFREARDGFEAVTRRLSQATLNTYWDYDNPNAPTKYLRQSELRFISGPKIAGSSTTTPPRPTHSIFFQAPLGFVVATSSTDSTYQNYKGLENLLNTWGYYVEYNNDSTLRPSFLTTPTVTRFRLMEYMESSQALQLYNLEAQTPAAAGFAAGNASYNLINNPAIGTSGPTSAWAWFLNGVNSPETQTASTHILAENVIALVLLPKLTPAQETSLSTASGKVINDASLSPDYIYDSTGYDLSHLGHLMPTASGTGALTYLDPINQLPPIVQVTMVAIDEISASRLSASQNTLILQELGKLFTNSANFNTDLVGNSTTPASGLESYLQSLRVNYREFTTDVSIEGAKWSTNQTH